MEGQISEPVSSQEPIVDPEVYRLLEIGEKLKAFGLLSREIRLELIHGAPCGEQWSVRLMRWYPKPTVDETSESNL